MPSYRERVYLCPGESGLPVWVGQMPVWWDRRAFFEKFGGRRLDTGNPIYVDYALLLTQWEAITWDQQCRERFLDDGRSSQAAIKEAMRVWEGRLRAARWVIVESYEWESGME
jgi:hypothetical protein